VLASGYGGPAADQLRPLKPIALPKPYGLPELVAVLKRLSAADIWTPLDHVTAD
jgi:hypothetical protein